MLMGKQEYTRTANAGIFKVLKYDMKALNFLLMVRKGEGLKRHRYVLKRILVLL